MKTKEAIERVKARFDKWSLDEEDLAALQALGLVSIESEDERIRKEIVKYLTNELNNVEQLTPRTNEYERWITWLSLKFRVGDTISFKSKQYTIVGIDFDNHCYDLNDDECVDFDTAHYQFTLEKQKEQKPAECIEFDNEFKNQVSHLLASVLNKEWEYDKGFVEYAAQQLLEYAKHEIKPAEWSEEDERHKEAIIESIRLVMMECADSESIEEYENDINWLNNRLKSLHPIKQEWSEEDDRVIRDACSWISEYAGFLMSENKDKAEMLWKLSNKLKSLHPQPKVELTLLDENIIEAAIAFVEQNDHFNCWGCIDKRTVIKALRSLKPHWKPSKEQMDHLAYAYTQLKLQKCYAPHVYESLGSLYDDLKKLF